MISLAGGALMPMVVGIGILVGLMTLFAWLDPRKVWADVPLEEAQTRKWLEHLGWDQDADLKEIPLYVNARMANTGPTYERGRVVFPKGVTETWSQEAVVWRLRSQRRALERQRDFVRRNAVLIIGVIVGGMALVVTYVGGATGIPLGLAYGYVSALYLGMWIRRRAALAVDAEEAPRLVSGPDRLAATEALSRIYDFYARSSPLFRARGCQLVRMRAQRLGLTLDREEFSS